MISEQFAAGLFTRAIRQGRAAELLNCLHEGGTGTVDPLTGQLVLIPAHIIEGACE